VSTTTVPDPADRREARRARAKARAAAHPFGPEQDITIADLRVGDFLIVVPSQGGVRGARVGAVVTATRHSWDTWGQHTAGHRRKVPVPSTQIEFGVHRTSAWTAGLDVPDTFRATVRRPQ
jgi:hypothetical protein